MPGDPSTGRSSGAQRQLLDAAARLFAEHGVERVSVRAIAEEAGVSHGSVRYHFRSKQELYREVLREYGPRVDRSTFEALELELGDAPKKEHAERRLMAWLGDLLQAVGRPVGISDGLMHHELCRAGGPSDLLFDSSIRPHHDELEALLAGFRPEWDPRRCRVVAIGIIAQAIFFRMARPVAVRLLEEDALDTCADEIAEVLVATILDGIRGT
ncbi:MAG: CerR family C-terminal domain-containing protein [Planctomycetota bacterium]